MDTPAGEPIAGFRKPPMRRVFIVIFDIQDF
jgi:hypothetical protein